MNKPSRLKDNHVGDLSLVTDVLSFQYNRSLVVMFYRDWVQFLNVFRALKLSAELLKSFTQFACFLWIVCNKFQYFALKKRISRLKLDVNIALWLNS